MYAQLSVAVNTLFCRQKYSIRGPIMPQIAVNPLSFSELLWSDPESQSGPAGDSRDRFGELGDVSVVFPYPPAVLALEFRWGTPKIDHSNDRGS